MNSSPGSDPSAPEGALKLPLWTRGETNAFFGLGFNILVNVLTLTSLLIAVVQIPAGDVLGTVLPALGIAMVAGNVYYTFLARRLARRENRTDVTALPYGPSVPHMFIVVFVIMLPIYLATGDPMRAWEAGLAWAFVIGVIVLIGAFIGPFIRRITPRAAMLGTLAGISITFISMRPAAQIWEAAWIGLPVLGIILVGFFTNMRLPGGIPVGLAALLVGTAIGWIGGYMSVPDVHGGGPGHRRRDPDLPHRPAVQRAGQPGPAAGHRDPARRLQLRRGDEQRGERRRGGRQLQPAQRAAGRRLRRHHRFGAGLAVPAGRLHRAPGLEGGRRARPATRWPAASSSRVLCFLGLFGLLATVLPIPAIVPILLYIGLLIGAQAFQSVPRIQAAAVVAAIIPNLASWGTGLIDNALAAAGTTAAEVGPAALGNAGLVYDGLKILGEGAVLAGMVLGAIVAFILERRFFASAIAAAVGRGAQLDRADPRQLRRLGGQPAGRPRVRDARHRARRLRLAPPCAATVPGEADTEDRGRTRRTRPAPPPP